MPNDVLPAVDHAIKVDLLDTVGVERTEKPAIRAVIIDSVNVLLSIEIGRLTMPLKAVRSLKQGEVVGLERAVGDPMDIRINGKLVAKGEVVATDGRKYGIRLTEIVSPGTDESSV